MAGTTTKEAVAPDGDYVTVTWMIHDVSVWRIDRIFLVGGRPARIVTQLDDGSSPSGGGMLPGEAGNADAITHHSPDPLALQEVLTPLGVLKAVPSAGSTGPSTAAALPAADDVAGTVDTPLASIPAAGISTVAHDTATAGSPFWWVLAGLAAGAALMAAAVRWVPAMRSRRADPAGSEEPIGMVPIP